jgi:hypothetical protein
VQKISIREHEQTGRHKHNYRQSLKEKQFLDRKAAADDHELAAELRRIERDANRALGVADVPSVAPVPKALRVRLPPKSAESDAAAPPLEPFRPAYVPVVRAPSQAMYETSTRMTDAAAEQAFQELTAEAAPPPESTTGEAGEWTVVAANDSLELQQETDAASAAAVEAQIEAAKRKQKSQQATNADNSDDEDDDDDDAKGTIISGPRHLERAVSGAAASTVAAAVAPTFKKRKTGGGADRSVRKKVVADDDDE